MNIGLHIIIAAISISVAGQDNPRSDTTLITDSYLKTDILNSGSIDFSVPGNFNTTTRLIKIYIGEPGKFQIPLTVYSGLVSNSSIGELQRDFISLLLRPYSGLLNLTIDRYSQILKSKGKITGLQLHYHSNFRLLKYLDSLFITKQNAFNFLLGIGITFTTGAWLTHSKYGLGLFWMNFYCLYSNANTRLLQGPLRSLKNPNLVGCSGGIGIDITNSVDIRTFYFRYLNNQKLESFTDPFLQVSLNYDFR